MARNEKILSSKCVNDYCPFCDNNHDLEYRMSIHNGYEEEYFVCKETGGEFVTGEMLDNNMRRRWQNQ